MLEKVLPIITASALLSVCSNANAESEVSIGYKQSELNSVDLQTLFLEYEYKTNDYLSISLHAGLGLKEQITATLEDTYVSDITSTDIVTDTYEETTSLNHEFGISLNAWYPLINNWSVYGRLGYITLNVEDVAFSEFSVAGDTPPAEEPETAFSEGASLCSATGQEDVCGVSLEPTNTEATYDMGYSEIGMKWSLSDDATMSLGYLKSISSGESYDAFILRLGVGFW